jgi:enamine deaminase RidA (YjgF/YER057c/UK114 family)
MALSKVACKAGSVKQHYLRPDGLPPVSGYSHAVAWQGRTVVVSGQVPLDAAGHLVGRDDPARQLDQVFANLAAALAAAGASMSDVVKLGVYLTDLADLAVFRQARDRHLGPSDPPASTLVQVSGLINADFRVEIDAIAVV